VAKTYYAKRVKMETEDVGGGAAPAVAPSAGVTGTSSVALPPTTTPEKWKKKLKFLARRANPNGFSGK
jgi:hypothetical protein